MTEQSEIEQIFDEWSVLDAECDKIEAAHKQYLKKLSEVEAIQKDSLNKIRQFQKSCHSVKEKLKTTDDEGLDLDFGNRLRDLHGDIAERKTRVQNMLDELPRTNNGLYLSIILGSINLSLMNKAEKFRYKDEYEKFKLTIQIIAFAFASFAYIFHMRWIDASFHFLLVWYYCTLTIRESILRVNGSRIKGWWMFHHYVSTVLCGISLTWPDGECYQSFRKQFLFFSLYLSVVQFLQCQYQRGCLYRLRTLGQRHSMDITVDGFTSWMFKGLTFLLPFLFLAYGFQLYNAIRLVQIYFIYSCVEWQVLVLAGLFTVLSMGNTWTTGQVCWRKLVERKKTGLRSRLVTKYSIVSLNPPVFEKKQD